MRLPLLYPLFILVLFASLLSCQAPAPHSSKPEAIVASGKDSLVRDIPTDKNGRPRSFYRNKPSVEAKLGLPTLENGFDSLQIRIWYGYAFQDSSQLVILKKSRGEWQGEFYSLVYRYNEKGDSLTRIDKEVTLKVPKSGWESTISRLMALDILSLPDYQRLPNYPQGADGDAVIVEIATRKLYRIYSYYNTPHI